MKNQLETEELVIEDNLNPSISFKSVFFEKSISLSLMFVIYL